MINIPNLAVLNLLFTSVKIFSNFAYFRDNIPSLALSTGTYPPISIIRLLLLILE